ncbi:MAG: hypothetical protein K0R00_2877 [Herbinix sp.]|jgi:hypothetical protein|nr:hypothetical protein [Herbinix sp.]
MILGILTEANFFVVFIALIIIFFLIGLLLGLVLCQFKLLCIEKFCHHKECKEHEDCKDHHSGKKPDDCKEHHGCKEHDDCKDHHGDKDKCKKPRKLPFEAYGNDNELLTGQPDNRKSRRTIAADYQETYTTPSQPDLRRRNTANDARNLNDTSRNDTRVADSGSINDPRTLTDARNVNETRNLNNARTTNDAEANTQPDLRRRGSIPPVYQNPASVPEQTVPTSEPNQTVEENNQEANQGQEVRQSNRSNNSVYRNYKPFW